MFAVCDGHGANGKDVSNMIKIAMPLAMKKNLAPYLGIVSPTDLEVSGIWNAILKSFMEVNDALFKSDIDINFSGSTCILVFVMKSKVFVANVGDSRAVLYRNLRKEQIS